MRRSSVITRIQPMISQHVCVSILEAHHSRYYNRYLEVHREKKNVIYNSTCQSFRRVMMGSFCLGQDLGRTCKLSGVHTLTSLVLNLFDDPSRRKRGTH